MSHGVSTVSVLDHLHSRNDSLGVPGGDSGHADWPDRGDVVFNSCPDPSQSVHAYATLIHEAGHVLGITSAADRDPNVPDYTDGHPNIADSVMNYDWKIRERYMNPSFSEPDCSPHPFDIMAIYAIYQTYR